MADLVYQYKTNKGFYINQYVNGDFGIAFTGDVTVGKTVWSGKAGVKIAVTDPAGSAPIGEFAFGIQTGSIGPVTTTQKIIIDVITGQEKQVTEATFNRLGRRFRYMRRRIKFSIQTRIFILTKEDRRSGWLQQLEQENCQMAHRPQSA